jgi:hypothetical protein
MIMLMGFKENAKPGTKMSAKRSSYSRSSI